jgi:hypothetical protein
MRFWIHWILAGGTYCVALIFVLKSVFGRLTMIDELNRLLPENERFDPLGWYFAKYIRFAEAYRAAFPQSRQLQRTRLFGFCGMILMLTAFGIAIWPYYFASW